ncbi:hypothetical protein ACE2AJ_12430 [Aquihabitans daechungensis]|uniref:hypothetical protein n=1 Tax=Aquihabitans daechungensis TaxID=1052257 RepID=UPI003BA029B0
MGYTDPGLGFHAPAVRAIELLDHLVAVHRLLGQEGQERSADVAAAGATAAASSASATGSSVERAAAASAAEAGSAESPEGLGVGVGRSAASGVGFEHGVLLGREVGFVRNDHDAITIYRNCVADNLHRSTSSSTSSRTGARTSEVRKGRWWEGSSVPSGLKSPS